ncbi:hypothetical protein HPP92_003808 [Vanilla planifolia]|uniref:Uncharacterized protein n=1 Tax=Vanilla planifolia TaxID=51239 RepID=A0A835VHK1_VANPL|nr:hypothetical protein HPP92_003808 [Vanilla planifolia]
MKNKKTSFPQKNSSASTKGTDSSSSLSKTSVSGKNSGKVNFVESGKSSICRGSTSSDVSNESNCSSMSNSINKPHKANDSRWEAIQTAQVKDGQLGLNNLGCLSWVVVILVVYICLS